MERDMMLQQMSTDREKFSDCKVICCDQTLHCHRIVLSTSSPVWHTSLESNFQEGQTATIYIEDAMPEVVEALVCYAYTRKLTNKDVVALFQLAHRYEMSGLVLMCARSM